MILNIGLFPKASSDNGAIRSVASVPFRGFAVKFMVHLGMSCPLWTHTRFWRLSSTNESSDLVASWSSTTCKSPMVNYLGYYIMWISNRFQIPLAGDIRPYFTMQDSDHTQLVNRLPPKAGLLLGVTNPFFEKSCLHWPHVLSLGRQTQYVLFLFLFSSGSTTEIFKTVRDRKIQRWALLLVQLQVGRQKHIDVIFPKTASYSSNWNMLVLPKATIRHVIFFTFPSSTHFQTNPSPPRNGSFFESAASFSFTFCTAYYPFSKIS